MLHIGDWSCTQVLILPEAFYLSLCVLQAGIAESSAIGGMRPEGKADFVHELRSKGQKVSMVGDGINDAPALAAAHVGIAFKSGLDVAGEAASVILMSDRLGQVWLQTICSAIASFVLFYAKDVMAYMKANDAQAFKRA